MRGEVGGTDLLCDTSSLIGLHIGLPELVQDQRLTRIDVTHDADDRAPQRFAYLCCAATRSAHSPLRHILLAIHVKQVGLIRFLFHGGLLLSLGFGFCRSSGRGGSFIIQLGFLIRRIELFIELRQVAPLSEFLLNLLLHLIDVLFPVFIVIVVIIV